MKYQINGILANFLSVLPLSLVCLLRFFGSDKQMPGNHSYGPTYSRLFRPWKYRPVKLLEVGVLSGRSLLAWQAYFLFGSVVAFDIEPKTGMSGWRRRIMQLDQSSATDLAKLSQQEAPFDIIIDDGSHFNAHQLITFGQLFDSLSDGGIYVVEDVQTSFWPDVVSDKAWGGAHFADPSFRDTCYGYFLELSKYLNHAEFPSLDGLDADMLAIAQRITRIAFEHNLIIVHKGDNTEPSNMIRRV